MKIQSKIIATLIFSIASTIGVLYFVGLFEIKSQEVISVFGGLSVLGSVIILFTKIYFDLLLKKEEIKFNKLFEHKLNILKEFIIEFSEIEFRLKNLRGKKIVYGSESKELQEDWNGLQLLWIKMISSYRIAKFFLKVSESNALKHLYEKIDKVDELMRSKNIHNQEIESELNEMSNLLSEFEFEIKKEFGM
jgi:hypothetical protein